MGSGCGIWHRSSPRASASPGSIGDVVNSSTICWSLTCLVKAMPTVATGEIEIPSMIDQPSERPERQDQAGSDHRPVVGRFELD